MKAQTENELLDKLVILYFSNAHIDKLTFHGLYEEWLDYKASVTDSPNTIKRHRQHYHKYFAPSILDDMKVKQVDELLLEKECNRIVREFNLPRKEWCNAKTILNGMYTYAIRKKYLTENPMTHVEIRTRFRQVVRKTGKTQTFNTEEQQLLIGLRVAEHTKTNHDRLVIVVPKAADILGQIERRGEYIFIRDGERITSIRIATILRKFARSQNAPLKSSHKLRKTYASNLNKSGVPLDCIREQLGHASLATTLEYIYNPLTENQTYDLITKAL